MVLYWMTNYIYDSHVIMHIMIATVEIRRNGVITVPDTIRKALGLKEGDFIEINVDKAVIPNE